MAEKRQSLGQSLMGLFVQRPAVETSPATKTSPAAETPTVLAEATPPVETPTVDLKEPIQPAELDFPSVLRRQGVNEEDQAAVDKTLALLHKLPADTPVEVRRSIVSAALSTFGTPVDRIIEAALLHEAALDRHVQLAAEETAAATSRVRQVLDDLDKQVQAARQREADLRTKQQGIVKACADLRARVGEVVTFFGPTETARVRESSARLRDVVKVDTEAPATRRPS